MFESTFLTPQCQTHQLGHSWCHFNFPGVQCPEVVEADSHLCRRMEAGWFDFVANGVSAKRLS
jgi:hypothetical protein